MRHFAKDDVNQENQDSIGKHQNNYPPALTRGFSSAVDFTGTPNLDEIRKFLDRGADVNVTGPADQTTLHRASYMDRFEIAALRLDRGAAFRQSLKPDQ